MSAGRSSLIPMAIKVGDIVFQGKDSISIVELRVEKVGRKFFYLQRGSKYDLETMTRVADWGEKPTCYTTRKALLEVFERNDLRNTFQDVFGGYGSLPYSLDQMRRIKTIIDEKA